MSSSYTELRFFRSQVQTITSLHPPLARQTSERLALHSPDSTTDLRLFRLSEADDAGAFLCLRCHISHALMLKLRDLADTFKVTGVQLHDIAGFALLDDGDRHRRQPLSYVALHQQPVDTILPFTASVICSYNPERGAGLPHWARVRLKGHKPLQDYLRDVHGIKLISDWALLANSSPTRMEAAWRRVATAALTPAQVLALHAAYGDHYKQDRRDHRRNGPYEPSDQLLRSLQPDVPVAKTLDTLRAMATAIRRYVSPDWQRQLKATSTDADSVPVDLLDVLPDPRSLDDGDDAPDPAVALIRDALARALDSHMPAVLAMAATDPQIRCLWQGFVAGLTTRTIAERCGCSQTFVSRQLSPQKHAGAIAQKAALELARHSRFAAVAASPDGAIRLVEVLKAQLLLTQNTPPEQEGDTPLPSLRPWVHRHLLAS